MLVARMAFGLWPFCLHHFHWSNVTGSLVKRDWRKLNLLRVIYSIVNYASIVVFDRPYVHYHLTMLSLVYLASGIMLNQI